MDHSEGKLKLEQSGAIAKITNRAEAIAYAGMTGGEHFLQMGMVLALLQSHRVVNGIVMSRSEFVNNRKKEVITPLLTEAQKKVLADYITKADSYGHQNYNERDVFTEWVRYVAKDLTDEQKKTIAKALNETDAKALEIFEGKVGADKKLKVGGFPTVMSMFKYDDRKTITAEDGTESKNYNFGKVIVDPRLSRQQEAVFADRAKALNQSLHGVYNTLDRSRLQNSLAFEVAFQFRKWIYPTWVRYMGSNFSLSPTKARDDSKFNESLGRRESGIFIDFAKFVRTPMYRTMLANKDAHIKYTEVVAYTNMIKAFGSFVKNYQFEYAILNNTEKANVRKACQFITNTLMVTGALLVAGAGYKKDDDKDKLLKFRSWAVYNLAGLQTEHADLIPFWGWAMFYKQTKQNIVPMEKSMGDLAKLLYDISAVPFRSEHDQMYHTGIYKGKSKVQIDLEKSIPVYRQFHKEQYMSANIGYYNMFNPVFNLWGGSGSTK